LREGRRPGSANYAPIRLVIELHSGPAMESDRLRLVIIGVLLISGLILTIAG
jgi:hypothetical protein